MALRRIGLPYRLHGIVGDERGAADAIELGHFGAQALLAAAAGHDGLVNLLRRLVRLLDEQQQAGKGLIAVPDMRGLAVRIAEPVADDGEQLGEQPHLVAEVMLLQMGGQLEGDGLGTEPPSRL